MFHDLDILKNTGGLFCRMSLSLRLYDVFSKMKFSKMKLCIFFCQGYHKLEVMCISGHNMVGFTMSIFLCTGDVNC